MSSEKHEIVKLKSAEVLRKVMDEYFLRLKTASENRLKKIAWCTSVGPAELLSSMGFEVFFPENHAAMIGASKTRTNIFQRLRLKVIHPIFVPT